jgi:hypothetical protein
LSSLQIDNSYLADKIALRLNAIPRKQVLNVIDAYHGQGSIWKNIQARYKGQINILKIDKKKKDQDAFVFLGDNSKFLSSLDLKAFDVVDLDAYGVPFDQLKSLWGGGFRGVCFVTFIQSVIGILPKEFLYALGYTENMVEKIPTLFSKGGFQKLLDYLSMNGVKKVRVRKFQRKAYLAFQV